MLLWLYSLAALTVAAAVLVTAARQESIPPSGYAELGGIDRGGPPFKVKPCPPVRVRPHEVITLERDYSEGGLPLSPAPGCRSHNTPGSP